MQGVGSESGARAERKKQEAKGPAVARALGLRVRNNTNQPNVILYINVVSGTVSSYIVVATFHGIHVEDFKCVACCSGTVFQIPLFHQVQVTFFSLQFLTLYDFSNMKHIDKNKQKLTKATKPLKTMKI